MKAISKALIERKDKLEKLSIYIGNYIYEGKNQNISKKELTFLIKDIDLLISLKHLKL